MAEAFELNFVDFIENIVNQVDKTASSDLNVFEKKYVKNAIKNYTSIAADYTIQSGYFSEASIFELIRLIAKWTYHKCIDLMKSTVPQHYWDGILLRIHFTIFEFYKAGKINEYSSKKLNSLIEEEVNLCYSESIKELKSCNLIDEETFARAIMQSNIDDFLNPEETFQEKLFIYLKKACSILLTLGGIFICFQQITLTVNEICFAMSVVALGCYMLFRNEVVVKAFNLYTIFGASCTILLCNQFITSQKFLSLFILFIISFSAGLIIGYKLGQKKTELL